MIWLAVLILAGAIFALAVWRLRVPRSAYGALAAALAVGLAGYAVQGRPDLPDRPTDPVQADADNPGLLVDLRRKVTNSTIPPLNRWVIVSDALARNGDYVSAAGILRGAIEEDPKNSEAWLALGNALLMHAHGFPHRPPSTPIAAQDRPIPRRPAHRSSQPSPSQPRENCRKPQRSGPISSPTHPTTPPGNPSSSSSSPTSKAALRHSPPRNPKADKGAHRASWDKGDSESSHICRSFRRCRKRFLQRGEWTGV
ncbi:tetratricopeptide repeat protein [Novosphingobium sp. 9]|uniref:tetratricopeptide repeat protein n=1 Tax=Novosphingobium sp. 9 TaxID=2025349 RepID=UPI0021B567BB|nr:tetratricopeptide repeat protein [Novosphingobium sp. 9]